MESDTTSLILRRKVEETNNAGFIAISLKEYVGTTGT
jgi:hypothetical protein